MNTTLVAIVILGIVGVGIYIGAANLTSQYGIAPSAGSAGLVVCAPQTAEAGVSQPVRFAASGLAAGVPYHWASDQGRSEVIGTELEVRFTTTGQKTVYLFHATNDRWYRTACSVLVK